MLTRTQRERILCHLQRGWKLPDSLVRELWEAYEALERATAAGAPPPEPRVAGGHDGVTARPAPQPAERRP